MWEIEYTDEFLAWWNALDVTEQESLSYSIGLLEGRGPQLNRPMSIKLKTLGIQIIKGNKKPRVETQGV